MKKFSLLTSFILLLIVSSSCSSDSDDDNPIVNPDTEVTYTKTIKAIMDNNCNNCHGSTTSNGAPMSLTTFTEVKNAVENRNLISAVESGFMPPNGNLSATQIQNIKTWQANGFKQ
jgi:mono/diheme cytochrome c family protein